MPHSLRGPQVCQCPGPFNTIQASARFRNSTSCEKFAKGSTLSHRCGEPLLLALRRRGNRIKNRTKLAEREPVPAPTTLLLTNHPKAQIATATSVKMSTRPPSGTRGRRGKSATKSTLRRQRWKNNSLFRKEKKGLPRTTSGRTKVNSRHQSFVRVCVMCIPPIRRAWSRLPHFYFHGEF